MTTPVLTHGPQPMNGPHRYRNEFRWRVMPPEKAEAEGYFTRGFGNKAKALAYQKLIKTLYPDEPCALCDTGRYYDTKDHIYDTKE